MNLSIRDVIQLDNDNEYVVISKIEYENQIYYYLLNIYNHDDMKYGYESDNEFVEVFDKELITKLVVLFGKQLSEVVN